MLKKTIGIAVLSMVLGLPGAYFQAIVSEECDNYCFASGFPTPPLLYLWVAFFLLGSLLGLLAWIVLFDRQIRSRKWIWTGFTLISGVLSFVALMGALLGFPEATFLLLACALYVLIALFFIREVPQPEEQSVLLPI
jgi:hypothetical protein